ncbi:MAG: UPF0182 family protein [Gemmatimonadetes bacterium]|nr:UPF0182 family protein [Gemmatimonadota bacterium]
MTPRRWLLLLAASVAVLLFVGRLLAGIYGEWTWYAAMGALPVYRLRLWHEWGQRLAAGALAFAFALPNLYAVRASIVSLVLPRRLGNLDFGEAVPGRYLTITVVVLAALAAIALAFPLDDWTVLAAARLGVPFGESEPFNDRDLGFYVYHLPFERSVHLWAMMVVLMVGSMVVLLYAITPSLRWERGRFAVSTYVRRHLSLLAACLLLLVAWSYRLDGLSLLANGSGPDGAFDAFDHLVATPALTGLSLGALLSSVVVAWAGWHGYHRVLLVMLGAMLLAGPAERGLLPIAAHWGVPERERRAADRPYRQTRAAFTRRAFAIERIVPADSLHAPGIAATELPAHLASWDPIALERSADFARRGTAAAIDFDPSGGTLLARVLERPEADEAPWWLMTSLAGAVDDRGHPLAPFGADGPDGVRSIAGVQLWDGAPRFLVALDSGAHLAAPPFASWPERLGHAWHLRKPGLLWRDGAQPRSRIVYHREVTERVARLAPFFTPGLEVQPVVDGDSLTWLVELFATSDEYPIAEAVPFAGAEQRYVRHAATAAVQAQTGRVTLYADPHPDAYTRTWIAQFPELFHPATAMPDVLVRRRAPSADLLALQGAVLMRTGFAGDSLRPRALGLADDADAEFGGELASPFVAPGEEPALARSLALVGGDDAVWGTLVARGGTSPRTVWYRRAGAGQWTPLLSALQHAADSAGIQRGRTTPRRGLVTVVPTDDGLAYVQSFYDWHDPPSLAGVAVALVGSTGDQGASTVVVRAGHTLAEALGMKTSAPGQVPAAWRARVDALYGTMDRALRRGDWSAFGEAFTALGKLLRAAP